MSLQIKIKSRALLKGNLEVLMADKKTVKSQLDLSEIPKYQQHIRMKPACHLWKPSGNSHSSPLSCRLLILNEECQPKQKIVHPEASEYSYLIFNNRATIKSIHFTKGIL